MIIFTMPFCGWVKHMSCYTRFCLLAGVFFRCRGGQDLSNGLSQGSIFQFQLISYQFVIISFFAVSSSCVPYLTMHSRSSTMTCRHCGRLRCSMIVRLLLVSSELVASLKKMKMYPSCITVPHIRRQYDRLYCSMHMAI